MTPPTSARKVMQLGESVTLVVVSFAPLRRSIDCAVPDMAEAAIADAKAEHDREAHRLCVQYGQRAGHGDLVRTAGGDIYLVHLCGRPLPGTGR